MGKKKKDSHRQQGPSHGRHPLWLSVPPPPLFPSFMQNALSATTLPIYPGLGQALNNAGLHMSLLVALDSISFL